MLGVPKEHLEFPLWYLRRRGWTEILEGGQLAITVEGIDVLGSEELSLPKDRLLTDSSVESQPTAARSHILGDGDLSAAEDDDSSSRSLTLSSATAF